MAGSGSTAGVMAGSASLAAAGAGVDSAAADIGSAAYEANEYSSDYCSSLLSKVNKPIPGRLDVRTLPAISQGSNLIQFLSH